MTNALLEFAIGFAAFMAGWYAMQMAAEKLKQWSATAATDLIASTAAVWPEIKAKPCGL